MKTVLKNALIVACAFATMGVVMVIQDALFPGKEVEQVRIDQEYILSLGEQETRDRQLLERFKEASDAE